MDSQELRSLMEAYVQVHGENLEEGGASKTAETEFHQNLDKLVHKTFGSSPEEKKNEKVKKEEVDIFDVVLEFLCVEGYAETLEEAEWMMANLLDEESIDIILGEAEGSYGQTPKASAAYGKLATARRNKPASEYSQKGEKTKKVKSAEKHFSSSMRTAANHRGKQSTPPSRMVGRGKLDQDSRDYSREDDVEYGYGGHKSGSGTVTKSAKKLRKQRAMGEIAKEGYVNFEDWYMINILNEEVSPEVKKWREDRAKRLDYKDEVRAARRAWIVKANKGRPEYEGVKEAYQDPKFSRKDYLAKLQKRGGMGMGTKEDPHGYRDPKMAKVGAEFSKRVTAAHKAKKSGEPDAYRAEKEGQSKKK